MRPGANPPAGEPAATRRNAIRRWVAGGWALLAAGALPSLLFTETALGQDRKTTRVLRRLAERQLGAMVAYRRLRDGDLLDEEMRQVARLFASHERQHADALLAALRDLGGRRPDPPRPPDIEGLEELASQEAALEFAVELEEQSVAALADAAEALERVDVLRTIAQIAGSEAQQLAIWRQVQGKNPIPDAFVIGDGDNR